MNGANSNVSVNGIERVGDNGRTARLCGLMTCYARDVDGQPQKMRQFGFNWK